MTLSVLGLKGAKSLTIAVTSLCCFFFRYLENTMIAIGDRQKTRD